MTYTVVDRSKLEQVLKQQNRSGTMDAGTAAEIGKQLGMEVMPDHVHLLVECDPQLGIAKLIRYMKGRSSRYLRQEFPWLKSRLPTL